MTLAPRLPQAADSFRQGGRISLEARSDPLAPAYLSGLDEARFRVVVAKAPDLSLDSLPHVLQFCRDQRVRLLIARSRDASQAARRALHEEGFSVMDTLICWRVDLDDGLRDFPGSQEHIRASRPSDADAVRHVALRAFHGYQGHYHADPRLPEALCDAVYGDWAYRSCIGETPDHVLVSEAEGRIVGFASARLNTLQEAQAVLSAVDPLWRERRVYSALNIGRALWSRSQGATHMLSTTLSTNALTQRAYLRAGFVPIHAMHTFHKWFD